MVAYGCHCTLYELDRFTVTASGGGTGFTFGPRPGGLALLDRVRHSGLGEWTVGVLSGGASLKPQQSEAIMTALRSLLRSKDNTCRNMGTLAYNAYATGHVRYAGITESVAGFVDPVQRRIYLGSAAFEDHSLTATLAHEAFHFYSPGTMLPWNDRPNNAVYHVGNQCAVQY